MQIKEVEAKLKVSLIKAMNDWQEQEGTESPVEIIDMWWGDEISIRMADAALSVLVATYDVQQYMKQQGVEPI